MEAEASRPILASIRRLSPPPAVWAARRVPSAFYCVSPEGVGTPAVNRVSQGRKLAHTGL